MGRVRPVVGRRRWQPWQQRAWSIVNGSTAPLWLLMIALPRWSGTRVAVRTAPAVQAALGATYVGFLARAVATGDDRVDVRDGASVARGLANPDGMLAGWAHYLAFDLFVGVWIWRTGIEEGIDTRVALLLTWMAGPAGLTLFLWQRRRAVRRAAGRPAADRPAAAPAG